MRFNVSKFFWGMFFLLAAVFLLVNQHYNFTEIGIGSLIIGFIAFAIIVNCLINFQFAFLPVPLAVLYICFHKQFNLPEFQAWTLIIAAILASVGLQIIFPKGGCGKFFNFKNINNPGNQKNNANIEDTDENSYHFFSVNFGAISRRLRANNLENVKLDCKFGAIEIFFDEVQLSPNGAEVNINCSFGAVALYIPKDWCVIDNINYSVGGGDIKKNLFSSNDNAPKITLKGSVSFGGIEVNEAKCQ